MKVSQIYDLMNKVTNEVLGKNDLIAEDLSNVVDVGTELFNVSSADNFVRSLVDHIGKVIFVNRPYSASLPSVLRDGWEFGAACEKSRWTYLTRKRTRHGNYRKMQAMTPIFSISRPFR